MSKKRKIVWVSRHPPIPKQRTELERLFSGSELHIDHRPYDSADEIVRRFRAAKGDELVLVAPVWLMRAIIKIGIKPIYAEMVRVPATDPHEIVIGTGKRKRCFVFKRFVRCTKVSLEVEEIEPS